MQKLVCGFGCSDLARKSSLSPCRTTTASCNLMCMEHEFLGLGVD